MEEGEAFYLFILFSVVFCCLISYFYYFLLKTVNMDDDKAFSEENINNFENWILKLNTNEGRYIGGNTMYNNACGNRYYEDLQGVKSHLVKIFNVTKEITIKYLKKKYFWIGLVAVFL